jgi:hypothetical protein
VYLDEFHCVVVGNEPAGLWLLKRLSGAVGEDGKPLQCAWLRLSTPLRSFAFPTAAASEFGLTFTDVWHAELVTRRRNLEWRTEALRTAFPQAPHSIWEKPAQGSVLGVKGGQLSAHRKALEKHPELLGFAGGLWKGLGRTPYLQPEVMLWSTLLATELSTWRPDQEVPENVVVLEASEWDNPLEELKALTQGALSLKFRDLKPIVARHWVLNLPFQSFARLSSQSDALSKLLTTEREVGANRSLYRLEIQAEPNAVPGAVPPLAVAFDAESIPDWDTEVWPFETKRADGTTLELIASAPPGAPVEAVLDRFRAGLGRLNRLFPFLAEKLRAYSVPLWLESCHGEEARAQAERSLEENATELYAHTSLHTATRHKSLTALFPSLHCGVPYPLGPLSAARRVASDILGKPKAKDAKDQAQTEPPAAVPPT